MFSVQDKFAMNNLMLTVRVKCWVNATIDYQLWLISEDEINAKGGIKQYVGNHENHDSCECFKASTLCGDFVINPP